MITTKFNYVHENYGEVNTLPSATVPGDAMSLRDLLDRFARGLALPEPRQQPYYNQEEVFPNFKKMDLVDQEDYMENLNLRVEHLSREASLQQQNEPTPVVPQPSNPPQNPE